MRHLCCGIIPPMRTRHLSGVALAIVVTAACGGAEPAKPAPEAPPAAAAPAHPPARPATPAVRVYVTNAPSGTLTVIDAATQAVIATAALGKRPRGIQVSPDRTSLYVALSGSPPAPPGVDEKTLPPPDRSADGIGEIDVATNAVKRIIHAGNDPEQLAVSADGTRLYVANEDAAQLSVVDLASGNPPPSANTRDPPERSPIRPARK